jgi:hypothetical protein
MHRGPLLSPKLGSLSSSLLQGWLVPGLTNLAALSTGPRWPFFPLTSAGCSTVPDRCLALFLEHLSGGSLVAMALIGVSVAALARLQMASPTPCGACHDAIWRDPMGLCAHEAGKSSVLGRGRFPDRVPGLPVPLGCQPLDGAADGAGGGQRRRPSRPRDGSATDVVARWLPLGQEPARLGPVWQRALLIVPARRSPSDVCRAGRSAGG